jgi:hypothetical protein
MKGLALLLAAVLSISACGGVVDVVGESTTECSGDANGSSSSSDSQTSSTNDGVYKDITNASLWTTVSTDNLNIGSGFNGSAFDGRYIYVVPGGSGVVPRYDTQSDLSAASSWASFDVKTISPTAAGFRSAVFDGRYVYFVPYSRRDGSAAGTAVRYDTKSPYNAPSSWSSFDLTSINAAAVGYVGGVFDGRYVYFVPYGQDNAQSGTLARYDTRGDFKSEGSWTTFDVTMLNPNAKGFYGGTFDGRYLYLSPYASGWGAYSGFMTRFDTTQNINDPSSWSIFDTTTIDGRAKGFFGATFDGHYAYFVPYNGDGSSGGMLARVDTRSDFESAASWSLFDTTSLGVAPQGALFDGRFVYLVPSASPAGPSGLVARFDSTALSMNDPSAWSSFDVSAGNPDATWFFGGAFDGRYMYLFPSLGKSVARFDARKQGGMPSAYYGSFF